MKPAVSITSSLLLFSRGANALQEPVGSEAYMGDTLTFRGPQHNMLSCLPSSTPLTRHQKHARMSMQA